MRIFPLLLIGILLMMEGCVENYPSSKADVIITKVETEKIDNKFRITFHLKNVGGKKANAIMLNIYVENQDGYVRLKDVNAEVVSGLNPGATATKIETIQIRSSDKKYIANVEVWWMEGSRNYHYEWNIEQ